MDPIKAPQSSNNSLTGPLRIHVSYMYVLYIEHVHISILCIYICTVYSSCTYLNLKSFALYSHSLNIIHASAQSHAPQLVRGVINFCNWEKNAIGPSFRYIFKCPCTPFRRRHFALLLCIKVHLSMGYNLYFILLIFFFITHGFSFRPGPRSGGGGLNSSS